MIVWCPVQTTWIWSNSSLVFCFAKKVGLPFESGEIQTSTGHHIIDLLALQDKVRTMHVSTDTIPQYIAALEKAQLQAARAEMPIPDNYLTIVVTKTILSSERFPWAKEDWEDLEKDSKSWKKWCELYKK